MSAIDFVIAWVDGRDPDWQKRKAQFTGDDLSDDQEERYREWDLLRYWFRAVEAFAPWVNAVHFICDQEPPAWLNTAHPKLRIVRHEDYLPENYRPAFSSHPIELNLHRIKGLSEQFVYFNDDMYLLSPVTPDFFFEKNLPKDSALLNPVPTTDLYSQETKNRIFTIPLNNAEYLNRNYSFKACVKAHPGKWINLKYGKSMVRNLLLLAWPRFVGFDEPHNPQAFLKSSYEKAWQQYGDILDATSRHPLRNDRDVNHWLIREQQLAEGAFLPRSPKSGRTFDLDREGEAAARAIENQTSKLLCLNDGDMTKEQFEKTKGLLQRAFQRILPTPSQFEKETAE